MNELIERWVAGDKKAAEELYQAYYRRVKGFVVRLGENIVDAEDIAQEALVAGLEGIQSGKRPDRFTHWIMGIARNLRARRTRLETRDIPDLDSGKPGGRSLVIRREMGQILDETLNSLPAHDREVLELRHRSNLRRKEIAEKLGLSIETVHARFERAYARLRQALSRHFTTFVMSRIDGRPVTLEAVRNLRPAFREAVTARHLEGGTDEQAAKKLGVPVATVRARLDSAYELLNCKDDPDFSAARKEYQEERRCGKEEKTKVRR